MTRPSIEFLRYFLGLRSPTTSLTIAEQSLLKRLASNRKCVIEVGVHEGATSAVLATSISSDGNLWLVDPFFCHTRPERLFRMSYSNYIAHRSVQPWRGRVRFVRKTSIAAAEQVKLNSLAELIFIDADHSYPAVLADFIAWATHLSTDGLFAFHDSRMCAARPDLAKSDGPVRLVDEILRGEHGKWELATAVDSISVLRVGATARSRSAARWNSLPPPL